MIISHTQWRGKEWWMMACNWQFRCDDVMKSQHATLKWNNLISVGWTGTRMNVNFNKIYEKRGILPNAIITLFYFFSATEDTNKNGVSFNNEDWSDPANLTSFETFFIFYNLIGKLHTHPMGNKKHCPNQLIRIWCSSIATKFFYFL